jgi:hypothetical protein
MGDKIGVNFLDQTCNTHIWVGKYALVFVVTWISHGIFHMQVLHFGIGSSTTLTFNVNNQNMQYSHMGFQICYGFLDWTCNTSILDGKIGVVFFHQIWNSQISMTKYTLVDVVYCISNDIVFICKFCIFGLGFQLF